MIMCDRRLEERREEGEKGQVGVDAGWGGEEADSLVSRLDSSMGLLTH